MLKVKTRKLQSNQKLNTKLNYISQAQSPTLIIKKTESFTLKEKQQLQNFTLNIMQANQIKDETNLNSQKSKPKLNQSIRLQQMQRKVKEREELRKTKGLAVKMKIKLQDQIKTSQRQLEQKQSELKQLQSEIQMLKNSTKQRTKHIEDIANNQQMLKFKESQLNNLNTIHSEILEGAKKQLAKQKLLKVQNQQKLQNIKKKLKVYKDKWNDKQNRVVLIQQLAKEKVRLQKLLEEQRKVDEQKLQVKADAVREIVEELINNNKKAIEDDCEWKARIIREKSHGVKNVSDFKRTLQKGGVASTSYYTFNQLKSIKQLNFKQNKEAEKMFQFFQIQINPKIIQLSEQYEEPKELLQLKVQIKKLQEQCVIAENELKLKETEVQQLQIYKNSLASTVKEIKKKSETK